MAQIDLLLCKLTHLNGLFISFMKIPRKVTEIELKVSEGPGLAFLLRWSNLVFRFMRVCGFWEWSQCHVPLVMVVMMLRRCVWLCVWVRGGSRLISFDTAAAGRHGWHSRISSRASIAYGPRAAVVVAPLLEYTISQNSQSQRGIHGDHTNNYFRFLIR